MKTAAHHLPLQKTLPLVTLINSINIKSSDTGYFEKMIFLVTTPQKSQIWYFSKNVVLK